MKRRSPPESSQTLLRIPGNLFSRRSMTSFTVPASTSTTSAPPVCFRRGVGITTLSDMNDSSFHNALECLDSRVDHFGRVQSHGFRSLQSIAGDSHDGDAPPIDMAGVDKFLEHSDADAARCLRVDALRFGEQADSFADLRVSGIVSPASAALNKPRSVVAISGVADGQRLRNRVGLDGTNVDALPSNRVNDRIAADGLRAVELRLDGFLQQPDAFQFPKTFVNL